MQVISTNNSMYFYQVYGLTVQINQRIECLNPTSDNTPVDVCVELLEQQPIELSQGKYPDWVAIYEDGLIQRRFQMWTATIDDEVYFWLRYSGQNNAGRTEGHDFVIAPSGKRVWVTWTAPRQDMIAFLLGPVLGSVLRLRGTICLHASVVKVGNQAIAILGQSGAGKSTTAAAFAQLGLPVLSDDIAALVEMEGKFLVQPGYPRLRLVPAAATALVGSSDKLSTVFVTDRNAPDKRYLDVGARDQTFPQQPYPLAAIYFLQERNAQLDAPFITPLPASAGLLTLMQHTSASFILDKSQRAQEFKDLGRLANQSPLRVVHRPDALSGLPRLCETILNDLHTLTTPDDTDTSILCAEKEAAL